jgi:hypothetical protein
VSCSLLRLSSCRGAGLAAVDSSSFGAKLPTDGCASLLPCLLLRRLRALDNDRLRKQRVLAIAGDCPNFVNSRELVELAACKTLESEISRNWPSWLITGLIGSPVGQKENTVTNS